MSKAPLWTVAEAAKALGLPGDFPATEIDFVTQDSRLVKPGSLFVALSGTPSGGVISSFASARGGLEFAAQRERARWLGSPAAPARPAPRSSSRPIPTALRARRASIISGACR